jgi:TP53 regulating kinase and related kinases
MKRLLQKGVRVPRLLAVDEAEYTIEMEWVAGRKLKDHINDPDISPAQLRALLDRMGHLVLAVHEAGIIHGDLTTSNMLVDHQGHLVLIDFGLSYFKDSAEDRAVDLYVLERAFKSTHPALEDHFNRLLIAYGNEAALKKLEVVRQRGRKKVAFG